MKYVFVGPNSEPLKYMMNSLIDSDIVEYVENPTAFSLWFFRNIFLKILYRKAFDYDLQKVFARKLCRKKLHNVAQECQSDVIVYFYPWINMMMYSGIIDELKERFPVSKHVAIFYDINIMHRHDLEIIKQKFDLVSTYDQNEAEKAGIIYIPPVYDLSENSIHINEVYDLVFIGKAKDRLDTLLELYDYLENKGVKCYFYIVGTSKNKKSKRKGLQYSRNEIPVERMLGYIRASKCILDLTSYGTTALTARHREAIIYNKKLLSNNKEILNDKYYSEEMMLYFDDISKIDTSFFYGNKVNYNYQGEYNAENLLLAIEKNLK